MLFSLPRTLFAHLFLYSLSHLFHRSKDFPGHDTKIAFCLSSLCYLMPCYVMMHFSLSAPLEGNLPKVRDYVLLTAMHFYCLKLCLAHR